MRCSSGLQSDDHTEGDVEIGVSECNTIHHTTEQCSAVQRRAAYHSIVDLICHCTACHFNSVLFSIIPLILLYTLPVCTTHHTSHTISRTTYLTITLQCTRLYHRTPHHSTRSRVKSSQVMSGQVK